MAADALVPIDAACQLLLMERVEAAGGEDSGDSGRRRTWTGDQRWELGGSRSCKEERM